MFWGHPEPHNLAQAWQSSRTALQTQSTSRSKNKTIIIIKIIILILPVEWALLPLVQCVCVWEFWSWRLRRPVRFRRRPAGRLRRLPSATNRKRAWLERHRHSDQVVIKDSAHSVGRNVLLPAIQCFCDITFKQFFVFFFFWRELSGQKWFYGDNVIMLYYIILLFLQIKC